MYAILDIEATGGKKGEEDIIEIAIYKFDGKKVIDQVISLVQPERKIDPYVQKLTKITEKMVKTAPKFHELAKRIVEITEGTILVGHNVEFDYRMLKQEFKKLGYPYYRETIDTIDLSKKHFPNAVSYSLGKLSKELGIPVSDRHRASGDARATVELFKLLLEKDTEKAIAKHKAEPKKAQSKFTEFYQDLPNAIGLFYFLDENDQVIYLARTNNIAQGVRKVLTGKTALSNQIRRKFKKILQETTGNDLIARIKEINEIKQLKPPLNTRTLAYPLGLYLTENEGYKTLKIARYKKTEQPPLMRFVNEKMSDQMLSLISEEFDLCAKLNGLSPADESCFSYKIGECHGACEKVEKAVNYNERVDHFLEKIHLENRSFLLIGLGREIGEKSFVWIEDGQCLGYAYYELHHQIKTKKRRQERMTPIVHDELTASIIQGFLFTEKYTELISLNS